MEEKSFKKEKKTFFLTEYSENKILQGFFIHKMWNFLILFSLETWMLNLLLIDHLCSALISSATEENVASLQVQATLCLNHVQRGHIMQLERHVFRVT